MISYDTLYNKLADFKDNLDHEESFSEIDKLIRDYFTDKDLQTEPYKQQMQEVKTMINDMQNNIKEKMLVIKKKDIELHKNFNNHLKYLKKYSG